MAKSMIEKQLDLPEGSVDTNKREEYRGLTFVQCTWLVIILCAGIWLILQIRDSQQKAEVQQALNQVQGVMMDTQLDAIEAHIQACKAQGYKGGPNDC